jgi:hypothetical protein
MQHVSFFWIFLVQLLFLFLLSFFSILPVTGLYFVPAFQIHKHRRAQSQSQVQEPNVSPRASSRPSSTVSFVGDDEDDDGHIASEDDGMWTTLDLPDVDFGVLGDGVATSGINRLAATVGRTGGQSRSHQTRLTDVFLPVGPDHASSSVRSAVRPEALKAHSGSGADRTLGSRARSGQEGRASSNSCFGSVSALLASVGDTESFGNDTRLLVRAAREVALPTSTVAGSVGLSATPLISAREEVLLQLLPAHHRRALADAQAAAVTASSHAAAEARGPHVSKRSTADSNDAAMDHALLVGVQIDHECISVFVPHRVELTPINASSAGGGHAPIKTKKVAPTVAWLLQQAANRYARLTNRQCTIARVRYEGALVLPEDLVHVCIRSSHAPTGSGKPVFDTELAGVVWQTMSTSYDAALLEAASTGTCMAHADVRRVVQLADAQPEQLMDWDLEDRGLSSVHLVPLLLACSRPMKLGLVNFCRNVVDDHVLTVWTSCFRRWRDVPTGFQCNPLRLRLAHNSFSATALAALFHQLAAHPSDLALEELDLAGLSIRATVYPHLLALLQICPNMTSLNLAGCGLESHAATAGALTLAHVLAPVSASLRHLSLADNPSLGDAEVAAVIEGLTQAQRIHSIDVRPSILVPSFVGALNNRLAGGALLGLIDLRVSVL